MKHSIWIVTFISLLVSGCQTNPNRDPAGKVTIFDPHADQMPDNRPVQPNDETIVYYHDLVANNLWRGNKIIVEPSSAPLQFTSELERNEVVDQEMASSTILSYLYYEDGRVIYDALPPENRFSNSFNNDTPFKSNSVGKSIVSYLIGHAICRGYIESVDAHIKDWPLMENTLYYGQPLINLLNMQSGDDSVIRQWSSNYTKTGRSIHHAVPLQVAVNNPDELKDSTPSKHRRFSYSNLTADVLTSYLLQRVGLEYEEFLSDIFQNKIKIAHRVYIDMNSRSRGIQNWIDEGAGQYTMHITRYDYLRIAKAMMDDWQNDTCEGRYLKDVYARRVSMGRTPRGWNSSALKWGYPAFNDNATKYGGQFWTDFYGLNGRTILLMDGYLGQQIILDMDNSRIVVINAAKSRHYNTRKLGYEPIKYGRIQ